MPGFECGDVDAEAALGRCVGDLRRDGASHALVTLVAHALHEARHYNVGHAQIIGAQRVEDEVSYRASAVNTPPAGPCEGLTR